MGPWHPSPEVQRDLTWMTLRCLARVPGPPPKVTVSVAAATAVVLPMVIVPYYYWIKIIEQRPILLPYSDHILVDTVYLNIVQLNPVTYRWHLLCLELFIFPVFFIWSNGWRCLLIATYVWSICCPNLFPSSLFLMPSLPLPNLHKLLILLLYPIMFLLLPNLPLWLYLMCCNVPLNTLLQKKMVSQQLSTKK